MSAPGRKVKYHQGTLRCPHKTKGEVKKIELLNNPIYSLEVSYARQTLQVASIISQHLSRSLALFSQSPLPLSLSTFPPVPPPHPPLPVFQLSDC